MQILDTLESWWESVNPGVDGQNMSDQTSSLTEFYNDLQSFPALLFESYVSDYLCI